MPSKVSQKKGKIRQGQKMLNFGASKFGVGGAWAHGAPWIRIYTQYKLLKKKFK